MASTTGSQYVSYAESFVGKLSYKLGSSVQDTASGITADCSSFVQMVFSRGGINLPRTADQQYKNTQGASIAKGDIQTGDLLFFGGYNTPENPPGYQGVQHVGIYAGNGQVVQEIGTNVQVTSLASMSQNFLFATRPTTAKANDTNINVDSSGNSVVSIFSKLANGTGISIPNPLDGVSIPNPLDAVSSTISAATDGIAGAIGGIGNTFADVTTFIGVVLLALVLIIGGIILIRPSTISDAGKAAGTAAMA